MFLISLHESESITNLSRENELGSILQFLLNISKKDIKRLEAATGIKGLILGMISCGISPSFIDFTFEYRPTSVSKFPLYNMDQSESSALYKHNESE